MSSNTTIMSAPALIDKRRHMLEFPLKLIK